MRHRRTVSVLATGAACLALGLSTTAAHAAPSGTDLIAEPGGTDLIADPTSLVNPYLGTGNGGATVGDVNTFPGAAAPFGMLTWSPDTTSRPTGGGYSYADSAITGFSLTHLSGVGCPVEDDVPILPTVGAIGTNPGAAQQPFSHAGEVATPGYYSVGLGPIQMSVATTTRTGIGRITFPSSTQSNVLFKVSQSKNQATASSVDIVGDDEVTGSVATGHFCATQQQPVPVYFAAQFNRPFATTGTWNGSSVTSGSTSASGTNSGAWVSFDTTASDTVLMKVAVSYVSTANAQANLRAEDPGWSVRDVADATARSWRDLLSEIQIGGGTHDEQVEFYTALYHALLTPTVFSDADGQYPGFDGRAHTAPRGTAHYTSFSGWDIYRSEIPLLATLAPKQTSQMAQSLVDDARQGGWLPKWPVGNAYTGMMNGDAADPIIAEAYAYGARDFDARDALSAMVKGATVVPAANQLGQGWYEERPGLADYLKLGYVPNDSTVSGSAVDNGASETLEYATADFAISQLASQLGNRTVAGTFRQRSQNWAHLYNVDSGYLQPRTRDGQFPPSDPLTAGVSSFGQSGFQEGNAAQYVFGVPQNLAGIISAIGGQAATVSRLDTFFTQLNAGPNDPYYWAGNETDLLAPWVYDYAGAPHRTQDTVHRLLTTVYANTPGGEPGNDDLGAMSSWYVWSAIGMYPVTPGSTALALSSPLFTHVRLNLPHHTVDIEAPGVSDSRYYVQAMTLDGHAATRAWLDAGSLTGPAGGTTRVRYTIGDQPNRHWAASPAAAPPSYPAGPATFPAGLTPVDLTSSPSTVTAIAGQQVTATVSLTIGAGSAAADPVVPRTVRWAATPPAGLTVTPNQGTVAVSAGVATVPLTLSAAPDATQGFGSIAIALTSTPRTNLPTVSLPVTVISPGDTASIGTVLGATNTDYGLSQNEEGGDGATTPVTVGGQSARQTVQLVANDLNMYFRLDPRIAHDQTTSTTFTVQYYDQGTDGWSLQYDAGTGAAAYTTALHVTETGTGTWKTATVTVPDSQFANHENGASDFRIASGSPVIIHSVQLQVSGPGVLPIDLWPY
ncbi:MAG TPA: GH92 family glycosyl hydrolase [Rugosimonospora sp.]